MIKVTIAPAPSIKEITFECPNCKNSLTRIIHKYQKEGETSCGFCGAILKWKDIEEA